VRVKSASARRGSRRFLAARCSLCQGISNPQVAEGHGATRKAMRGACRRAQRRSGSTEGQQLRAEPIRVGGIRRSSHRRLRRERYQQTKNADRRSSAAGG
jgi:hypothetical protein